MSPKSNNHRPKSSPTSGVLANDGQYLTRLRHSTAHLLAAAVVELWPDAQPAIGPAIEDGFYYDIAFPEPISNQDLPKIEQKMRQLVKSWSGFERQEVSD